VGYAEAFKSLRHAYKLTQAEFAELLQVSKPTIQKLEAGDYPPSEKMTARLAELFRSERFRTELRPRVEAGDLRFVGMAFGALLEFADAGDATVSPAPDQPDLPDSLAGVYKDMKRDHAEFLAMMRSQQDTIHNLSESSKSFAVSTQNLSETSKTLATSTQNLSETNRSLAESNNNLTVYLSKGRIRQQCS
jgi:transcriptional regulator with XRE-family HTH domain